MRKSFGAIKAKPTSCIQNALKGKCGRPGFTEKRKGGKRHSKQWIQKAIKKPGALKATVKARFGERGFVKTDGKVIRSEVLRKLAGEKGLTGQRARLAITLKGLRKKRKA